MKKHLEIIILIVIIACSSDTKKSMKDPAAGSTNESISKVTPESHSDRTFALSDLDKAIRGEKRYDLETITGYHENPIDPKMLDKLLYEYKVLDASRRSVSVKGEETTFTAEYYYYNLHEFEKFYVLTLLEKIPDGPEYAIYGMTIHKENNKILDSRMLMNIWTDQYMADLQMNFDKKNHFSIELTEKNVIETEPVDSLMHFHKVYSYKISGAGIFQKIMTDSVMFTTALLDYEKGLVDAQGKRENVLYVILPSFELRMPNFFEGDYPPDQPFEGLIADHSYDFDDITLDYSLGGIYGMSGEIFNNDIEIIPTNSDFQITGIEIMYSTTLLFNEEGMGGVYTIEGIDEYESGWVPVKKVDKNIYHTPSQIEMKKNRGEIPPEDFKTADDYVADQDVNTDYSEYVIYAGLRIEWTEGGKSRVMMMNFDIEYGD